MFLYHVLGLIFSPLPHSFIYSLNKELIEYLSGAPRGTRTSSAACTPSVMVAAGSTCRGQAVTRFRERHPRPPQAKRDPRKQPRPPGCLCLFSLETNAPPAPSRRRGLGGPSPTAGAGAGARGVSFIGRWILYHHIISFNGV